LEERSSTSGGTSPSTPRNKRKVQAPEWTPEAPEKKLKTEEEEKADSDKVYTILEAANIWQREQVWEIHKQKQAFQNEHEFIRRRVFDNDDSSVQCRSWLLEEVDSMPAGSDQSESAGCRFLAAVTIRLNPYLQRRNVAWAQIMNLSVTSERRGHGTRLIAGIEELLRRECVDVVILYPVFNLRATSFWTSMGYCEKKPSFLPDEELDTKNGALLPEGCKMEGKKVLLPRWEKKFNPDLSREVQYEARWKIELKNESGLSYKHTIDTQDERSWKPLKRDHWPLWRRITPKWCRLEGQEVQQCLEGVIEMRKQLTSNDAAGGMRVVLTQGFEDFPSV
jgi:hypothetical protein